MFRCTRAQLDGDFERAEQLAQEALAIGQRGEAENATHVFAQSMFNIRREQGRLAEVEEAVRGFVSLYPAVPAWRCALGLLLVEVGREAEARVQVETLGDRGFGALPRDANWLIAVTLLAEVCARLGDVPRARQLYEPLLPYAGRNVVVGRATACNGSASRLLGMLAATFGDFAQAERHFRDALAMNAAMGARPLVARTQLGWAEALLARAEGDDVPRARALLAEAIVAADAHGLAAVAERARSFVDAGRSGQRVG